MNFIILSASDKATVEAGNPYRNGAVLLPVARQGGVYLLNASVLTNPDFAAAHASLAGLPVKALDDPTFPPPLNEDG